MAAILAPSPDNLPAFVTAPEVTQRAGRCLILARYDLSLYRDGDFAACGLALPDFLSRAVPKRRAEFLAGRLLAREALARFGRAGAIGRDAHGAPVWPEGVQGSISHSHGTVGVWLGQGAATLGLDLEALADPRATRAICHTVLTGGDRALIGDSPDAALATAVFSAKEALYKALFPRIGRFFGFDHAEIVEIRADGLALRLAKPLSTDWPAGRGFSIAQHWRAGTVISQCEIAP
ncbi:4'-phosphopantetheinyl transferase family protein [Marinovum sp.]|uniref:4'-phosphopantetheinyl transferase family protein n=1 Tax=Marinovum sp. TaxID=2024839 RepID=UPI002B269403|nr:4'-phosphopantetheinyl transferase superfamily protein [Marinovum sp.]